MMEKFENSDRKTDIAAKYAVMLERYGHLADYNAEVEVQLMRERADRENIIRREVEVQVAAEKQRVQDALAIAQAKIRAEYASKDAELAAKQHNIEECERKLFENLQRREQEISMRIQAEADQKLEAVRNDAQHKLMAMIQDFLSAIKSLQSGDSVRMKECLDSYVQKAEETEKAYTSEITKVLASSAHKQQKKNQQCEKLVRMLFTRKSEKWNPGEDEKMTIQERLLGNVELSDEEKTDYASCVAQLKEYRQRIEAQKLLTLQEKKSSHGRNGIPENLHRLEPIVLYPEEFNGNESDYRIIGSDTKELVVPVKERYMVQPYKRLIMVLKSDPMDRPLEAPAFVGPIWKSDASAELLAQIEVNKYYNHLPFYRQLKMMSMSGYTQSKATLDGWHKAVCDTLDPLYELQKAKVLQSTLLAGDGSPMPVVDNEKHRTVKSYIVELRSIDTGIPIFLTAPEGTKKGNGRGKAIIQGYLADWKGYGFMCDACASYDWLGKIPGVCLCRCAAHARREMENALRENPTLSAEGLLLYQQIYAVEGMIRQENLSGTAKVSYRKSYAAPAWRVLQLWCMKHILEVPDDTLIYKAMNYVLRHYDELTGYLEIAAMPIDNNDTERSIRDMVMGKKAYLFCQNDLSCSHAAEMYSFFGACKVLGKNPEHWLTYALKHINTWPKDRLEELLPENWTDDII